MSRRKQLAVASIKRQKGVAGIWLGFTLVPIMGFTFWAVEGTRYVQEYNRLGDANEAAAMAMTIQDDPASAEQLAKDYLQSYVRDIDSMSVEFNRTFQEQDKDTGQEEFVQYSVDTITSHKSWFTSTFIPSFGEEVRLGGKAVAKKYASYLGDNNIDIVFVSDFSGSMNSKWSGSYNTKIKDLQLAISEVSTKILCSNIGTREIDDVETEVCLDDDQADLADKLDNKVALAPFNIRTRELNSKGKAFAVSQLRYRTDYREHVSPYKYDDINWNDWRNVDIDDVYDCMDDFRDCKNNSKEKQKEASRIFDVMGWSGYPDSDAYIDYALTVSDMENNKYPTQSSHYRVNKVKLYSGYGSNKNSQFNNVPLTNSLSEIEKINKMKAEGSTAAYQGILAGTQLLAAGNPHASDKEEQEKYDSKVKMLLIFSDGEEYPRPYDPKIPTILEKLVDQGMCDQARSLIPDLYIGFIGIDYNAQGISAFRKCVNDEKTDIINVTNLNDLIDKIEELIRNGSKSNGFTKLY